MRLAHLALAGALLAGLVPAARAQGHNGTEDTNAPHQDWSFNGLFGTFDRASAQRGFQVYKEVCSNCHSMKEMYYRNLAGIGLDDAEIKAIAASVNVPGGTDDQGNPVERPGLPSDHFRSPFPNDKAARAANNGALPPDQSLIVKARENGPDYVYALIAKGYVDPPPGFKLQEGLNYNIYMPGHQIAMAQPLHDDQVTYADGTKATLDQEARDVVTFLTWTSNPELEQRKRMGVRVGLFLILMTGLTYAVKRKIWADVH